MEGVTICCCGVPVPKVQKHGIRIYYSVILWNKFMNITFGEEGIIRGNE
jgi:hypothetical protein